MSAQIGIFLASIGVDPATLLTPDVKETSNFMDALNSCAKTYNGFSDNHSNYEKKSTRTWSNSRLRNEIEAVREKTITVRSKMSEIASIQLEVTDLQAKIQRAATKLGALTDCTILLSGLAPLALVASLALKQRICEMVWADKKKIFPSKRDYVTLTSLVSTDTTWADAIAKLDTCAEYSPLTFEQLCHVRMLFDKQAKQGSSYMSVQALLAHFNVEDSGCRSVSQQLIETFPVLLLAKDNTQVLVDMHELMVNGELFDEILTMDDTVHAVPVPVASIDSSERVVEQVDKQQPGRVPLIEQYPQIVSMTTEFIRANGFKAQERRRTETGSCGVTLEQIRKHLVDNIPGLKISLKSVHLLLRAPRKGTHAADGYKNVVDARPGVKDNSNRKSHPDQHHCASQVKTAREFGSDNKSQCVTLPCDDKSKIKMGLPAVSRYHQLNKFFVQSDSPQYNDHDFPVPGYLISPSGYMVIENGNNGTTVDGNGREHVVYAYTGPVTLFNRACVFHSSNVEKHINDILCMSQFREVLHKPMMVNITDGGPDWSAQSPLVCFYYGRLWKMLDLDLLVTTMYAPGHSALNPIEHAWSPVSGELAGVVLPDKLPEETLPPAKQSKLSGDQRRSKEATLFDSNLDVVNNILDGKSFDGQPITSIKVPCDDCRSIHVGDQEYKLQHYNDYETVKRYFKVSLSTVYATPELASIDKEWQLFSKHVDKRQYSVVYRKCTDEGCDYCTKHPIRCNDVMASLPARGGGSLFYAPVSSANGQYKTYLEMKTSDRHANYVPDEGLSGVTGRCEDGCCWVFASAADRDRHMRLVHRRRHGAKRCGGSGDSVDAPAKVRARYTTCKECHKDFPSPHYLLKHKKDTGHMQKQK